MHQTTDSPIAADILERIQALYVLEAGIRGQPTERRCAARRSDTRPVLDALKTQLIAARRTISAKSALAKAIDYALSRWPALTRYCDDGGLEIDNNIAENALRCVALGRNYAQRWAMHSRVALITVTQCWRGSRHQCLYPNLA